MAQLLPEVVLPPEIWLKILSFLDLRSKGRMACVSNTLQRIVKRYDDILWRKVDLINQQGDNNSDEPTRLNLNTPPTWTFPPDEGKVLRLAHAYFGQSLQELHLHVVNTDILKYLLENCPNLEAISFHHNKMALKNVDLTFLPRNLKSIDLCLKGCFRGLRSRQQSCHFARNPLENLQFLTIRYTEFSHVLFERLCKLHSLKEIVLHQCCSLTQYGFNQLAVGIPNLESLWLRYCVTRGTGSFEFEGILHSIPNQFKHLKSLKVQLITKETLEGDFDPFLVDLESLTNLRSLWLENVDRFTADGMTRLFSMSTGLSELELVNCENATDEVVASVSRNLQNLKRLNLKGCTRFTDCGLRALGNHPFLEYLNVRGCKLSYGAICDTIPTLQSLKVVYLTEDTSQLEDCSSCKATLKEQMPHLKIYYKIGP